MAMDEWKEEEFDESWDTGTLRRMIGLASRRKLWMWGFLSTVALVALLGSVFTYIKKLVIDRASCEILGSAILGPRADDLIHLVSLMMYYGGSVHDIPRLPWYHPTLSEVMINLGRDLAGRTGGCERPPAPPA